MLIDRLLFKAIKLTGLSLLLIGSCMIALTSLLAGIGHWLAQPTHSAPVDAIVVLGGGYPNRMRCGIRLYEQNRVAELWRTGNVPGSDFARRAAQLAMRNGVPQAAIHLLITNSTWEDGREIAALAKAHKIQSILIVTDWSHSRRALNVIHHHLVGSDIVVHYVPADDEPYQPDNWWQHKAGRRAVCWELGKMVYYWLRYGVVTWV